MPVWKTETDFSLFDSFYDEKGSVTVNSLNGDNVIAPGTSKCYNFSLKNNSNVILDYNIKFDTTLKINDDEKDLTDFPILVRIKNDNEYFLGNDNLWVPIIELDNYTKSGVLDVGNYAYYLLEWKWNFEDNNIKDTILGKDATMNDIVLDITVFTESKLSKDFSSKVLSSDKAIPAFNEVSNDESDGKKCWSWWWLIVILILLLLGLIIRNILINQEGDVDEK
ncbi:MAG: hypothetical protein IJ093_02985 [Bacilli bacterium]|nr:hypothetical protein [Bacilli bacterium]